jgi:hypothetical protein
LKKELDARKKERDARINELKKNRVVWFNKYLKG